MYKGKTNILKRFEQHTKPYCVFGVLDTPKGRCIENEMLTWLSENYDVFSLYHDGTEYEYPAIKFTHELCLDSKETVLYIHTKGAGNFIPRNEYAYINENIKVPANATMRDWQKTVRRMWKHELTNNKEKYLLACNLNAPNVITQFTGGKKSTWNNSFFLTFQAAQKIKEIKKSPDRYFYEHMFEKENVNVIGVVYNDITTSSDINKMQSYIWKHYEKNKIIVSFTTYKQRVKYAPIVIESLLKQTFKPYKICLTLFKGDLQYITPQLQKYFDNGDVELIVSEEDIAPHKKYYYVMKKYKEYPIVTVDDDVEYANDLIFSLNNSYLEFPYCVSARRVHKIKYDENGIPLPYNKWAYEYKSETVKPSYDLFATGVGGVLYPPNILDIDNLSLEDINKSLYADDVLLKYRENQLNVPVVWVSNNKLVDGKVLTDSEIINMGLALTNNLKSRNDVYIKALGLNRKGETLKKVIYTCITGDYDPIVDPSYIAEGFKYICFTDAPNPTSPVWEFRPIPEELKHLSKVKQQRCIKICPHKYLPEFETSIWIDGNVDVLGDINIFLKEECSDKSKTVFIPTHPQRDCIYTEATKCIELKKDTANNINPQTAQYRKEGFPQQQGLVQTGIIIRRHNDPYCIELMEAWEKELIEHSHRDQLSFNYVLWKLGDKGFKYLDKNLFNSKYFKWYSGHNRNGYQHRIPSSPQPQPVSPRRGNPIYTPLQRGRMNPFRYYRRADRRTVMATPPDTVTHTVKINVTNNVKPEAPAPPPPSPTTNVPLTKNAVKRTDSAGKSVIEVKPSIRRQAGKNRTMATFSGR